MNRQERMHGKPGVKYGFTIHREKNFNLEFQRIHLYWRKHVLYIRSVMTLENGDLKQEEFQIKRRCEN